MRREPGSMSTTAAGPAVRAARGGHSTFQLARSATAAAFLTEYRRDRTNRFAPLGFPAAQSLLAASVQISVTVESRAPDLPTAEKVSARATPRARPRAQRNPCGQLPAIAPGAGADAAMPLSEPTPGQGP